MILGLRTYPVRADSRRPLLEFMIRALEASGCKMLFVSDGGSAPFVMTFETAAGERMGVVAYAFTATRTPTTNRPKDERSFQIKYGSKESFDLNEHEIWQDKLEIFTTIFLGIDVNDGIFVAADPEMHNPTKFFIRLEFKDHHAEQIKANSWHAWERDRRGPLAEPIEVLVGGTGEHFLDLIRFERAAKGLAPGDRQLLAEKREMFAPAEMTAAVADALVSNPLHPLVAEFELEPEKILELIASARRLKMAVRGWVAEEKLRDSLSILPGITSCERLDEEGGPDLRVRWKEGPPLTVECKNVLRRPTRDGFPRIDFQRTRASKADPCSRYYAPSDFDVVAGCLHAVTESWEFRYILPELLNPHSKCDGKIANNVVVGPLWRADPGEVFERAYARGAAQ